MCPERREAKTAAMFRLEPTMAEQTCQLQLEEYNRAEDKEDKEEGTLQVRANACLSTLDILQSDTQTIHPPDERWLNLNRGDDALTKTEKSVSQ